MFWNIGGKKIAPQDQIRIRFDPDSEKHDSKVNGIQKTPIQKKTSQKTFMSLRFRKNPILKFLSHPDSEKLDSQNSHSIRMRFMNRIQNSNQ